MCAASEAAACVWRTRSRLRAGSEEAAVECARRRAPSCVQRAAVGEGGRGSVRGAMEANPKYELRSWHSRGEGKGTLTGFGTGTHACRRASGRVRKKLSFWQKHTPTRSFYGSPPPPTSLGPESGFGVRGTVGPVWVRKVFNCFRSL